MLDYRIHTFLKVCETLNYTLAAKQLHITQLLNRKLYP